MKYLYIIIMMNLLENKMDYQEEKLIHTIQQMKPNKEEDVVFFNQSQNLTETIGSHL